MAEIKELATGKVFVGPDDAPTPQGFERVGAAVKPSDGPPSPRPRDAEPLNISRLTKLATHTTKPEGMDEFMVSALAALPVFGAAGKVAKLGTAAMKAPKAIQSLSAPMARVATALGLSKARGSSNDEAMIDAAGALVSETGLAAFSKALGVPAKALAAIRDRIGTGPDGPTNIGMLEKLLKFWKADPNPFVQSMRVSGSPDGSVKGIVPFLHEVDPEGVAGRMFRDLVTKGAPNPIPIANKVLPRFPLVSPGFSRAATAISGDTGRAAGDAVMGQAPMSDLAVIGAAKGAAKVSPSWLTGAE